MVIDACMRASALLLVLAVQACGGGGDEPVSGSGRAQASRVTAEALFAQDGRPSAAARQPPAGWQHATAAGLYATPEQLAWEALTVEPYTVQVDVDLHASTDAAVAKTLADYRWSFDGARAAYYVRAADARRAVAVADALTAAGVPLVFLVVEARS
jgi:hypothetical protein